MLRSCNGQQWHCDEQPTRRILVVTVVPGTSSGMQGVVHAGGHLMAGCLCGGQDMDVLA